MTSLQLEGADQLRALGKALREAGDKQLKRELMKASQRATRPVKQEIPASARKTLPSGGGLNDWVASTKVKTRTRTGGRNVGVEITGTVGKRMRATSDVRAINRGRLRHLTYGRPPWVTQRVKPGYWDDVMDGPVTQRARLEFKAAMDRIAAEIARSI